MFKTYSCTILWMCFQYEGTFEDYLEMFIQFGYVILFSSAYPLAGLCALLNNLIEIRGDAFKLCLVHQRPFGQRVNNIGSWQVGKTKMLSYDCWWDWTILENVYFKDYTILLFIHPLPVTFLHFQTAMELMGIVGIIVNCALIGQSGQVHRMFPNITGTQTIILVVVLEVSNVQNICNMLSTVIHLVNLLICKNQFSHIVICSMLCCC